MFTTLVVLAALLNVLDTTVVDLTHTFGPDPFIYPGDPNFNFTILFRENFGDYWYELNKFQTVDHGGTHVDAPSHFAEGKLRMHQVPIEKFIGPGVVINITEKAAENPSYRVSMNDIMAWESKYNTIPNGAIVLMNSGWSSKYPNESLGIQPPNDTFHFPGWKETVVAWLIQNRSVCAVGVDTPSVDYGLTTTFPVHVTLGLANIPGIENVANLDSIPERGSTIFAIPLKLYDASGSPARVFAIFEEDSSEESDTSEEESESSSSE